MITIPFTDNAHRFKMHELHGSVAVTFSKGEPVVNYDFANFNPDMPEISAGMEITFQGQTGSWKCSASDGVFATLFRQ